MKQVSGNKGRKPPWVPGRPRCKPSLEHLVLASLPERAKTMKTVATILIFMAEVPGEFLGDQVKKELCRFTVMRAKGALVHV
jgi:hypothetical protein